MAVISRVTTWSDNQNLTASALNGEFNNILNDYNGNITNANISSSAAIAYSKLSLSGSILNADINASAAIVESKIAFNTSTGHAHNGSDSKIISVTKNVTYGGFSSGGQSVANNISWNPRARAATTITRISAYVQTAPTGADMILRVFNITQNATVASVTISAGNNSATSTSITTASLVAGDILRFDCTQIGSSVAGSNVSVQVDGTE